MVPVNPLPPAAVTLPSGPHPVRTVQPPDSPWPATLARDGEGRPCLVVDAAALPPSAGLLAAPDGHIAVPRDLVRRHGGHALVMPLCVRRVTDFLQQRADASAPLSDGEAVTLAVSIARGTVEALLADGGEQRTGEWWLTDEGRPLLVPGHGDDVRTAARELLRRTADECRLEAPRVRAAVAQAAGLVTRDAGIGPGLDDAERLLFSTAAPEPLATAVLAPARARRVSAIRDAEPIEAGERTRAWTALLPHIDAELPELASRIGMALWRRLRADRPRARRRPILWAAGTVAGVVAVGLLWPQGADDPASAGTGAAGARAPHGSPSPRAVGRGPDPSPGGLPATSLSSPPASAQQAVAELLGRRARCTDAACLGRTQEAPEAVWKDGAATLPASQRTVAMLDDFGDVAVFRVHPRAGGTADQLVVIVRRDDSWLLRDIQDVSQQP